MKRRPQRRSPGLPRPVEHYLTRRHHGGAADRMMAAGTVRAIGVLLRRHPGAVAEAIGAGLLRAGRVGLGEFKDWLDEASAPAPPPRSARRLAAGERRRLLRFLKREARRDAAAASRSRPPAEDA